ncbi:quinone oxidoreductase family protein [Goodfellowiella coeruleoviolacea]|uniref:NADPH2:quinone reductase n=1 Tax=Goodfellowiella coeruleoviolacea TaxID=334858 RepID=A0AAE3GL71_9PSEU|nr:quinone oxidoreductase [Goodfellowiella coeruleoviolacea]MCP2170251.1 NADPH2:quinone reductase [Goodfellowiella coeruleoviolacea]
MPKAVRVSSTGGPEVLELVEVDQPRPGAGELLVEVGAAGVNYIDTYHRSGLYPLPLPFGLGLEGAGRVSAVGPEVTGFSVGDRVAWKQAPGSYAEQVVVRAAEAVAVPDGVSDEVAAAIMLQGMTAHYLVASTYPVQAGDTILVHAAAGGVGLLLIQLAKARGARVIGTVSTEEKERLARQAGADEVIRYTEVDFTEQVRRLTDGQGVAVVYDGVGRTTFDGSLASLRPRGTLVLFGASSGPVPPVDPQRLNAGGSLFLTRPTLAHYAADRAELDWRAKELFDAVADGSLSVRVGGRYPLSEARRAHEDLEGRRTTGKLVLLPH